MHAAAEAEDCLAVHYMVLPPLHGLLEGFGRFQASVAWYNDTSDPFGRGQSVMPWDAEAGRHVLHDPRRGPTAAGLPSPGQQRSQPLLCCRAFVVGLSDEAGSLLLQAVRAGCGAGLRP